MEPTVAAKTTKWNRRYTIGMVILAYLLMAVSGYLYTNYVDRKREAAERESDRQWCEIIVFYDDLYKANPPNPESPNYAVSKKNQELMHNRRIELKCDSITTTK